MISSTVSKPLAVPKALRMVEYVRSDVLCDWLSVTCSPIDSFVEALCDWLTIHGFSVEFYDDRTSTFVVGSGKIRVEKKHNFHSASASGGALAVLREHGLFRDYVNLLGSVGHKVTRLDVALDVAVDAPVVLSRLCKVYGQGEFKFGRKALRVKTLFENRPGDNAQTGTWYAGHKSNARVTARVYDKQLERARYGIITPPQTRYELTFRKDYGCSLWDALMPKSIFYSHSNGLVDPPTDGYVLWDKDALVSWDEDSDEVVTTAWKSEPVDTDLTIERFAKAVRYSPDLIRLAALAARFGTQGEAIVLREFTRCLHGMMVQSEDSAE